MDEKLVRELLLSITEPDILLAVAYQLGLTSHPIFITRYEELLYNQCLLVGKEYFETCWAFVVDYSILSLHS